MTGISGWENFYVIVGSSSAALIGLQFVFITLIATTRPSSRIDTQIGGTFATPSVVHFGTVLLLSAILSAPWDAAIVAAILWGLVGLSGMVYVLVVARRILIQKAYKPVLEDWVFHVLLPFAAYSVLAISSYIAYLDQNSALYLVAASAMLLLFIGIHNAWDAVTYYVFVRMKQKGT